MKIKRVAYMLGAATCLTLLAIPSMADTSKDIETLAKAISFIEAGPSGPIEMDILYNPGDATSSAHADEIAGLVANGVKGGKVTLKGKKITSARAATSKVILITKGTSAMHSAALDKAAANGGLTVSTDESCLESGCVLVVKTKPSVDIFVSTAAAKKTGTKFASAFSMMITKR